MNWTVRRSPLPSFLALVMLISALILYGVMIVPPAHAGNPAIANTANCSPGPGAGTSCQWTLTVANKGDSIAIAGSLVDSLTNTVAVGSILTITDTGNDIYTQQGVSRTLVGANCKTGFCLGAEIWSASALASGSDTITVTMQGPAANLSSIFTAFDMTNVSPGILFRDTGSCNAAGSCLSGTSIVTGAGNTFGAATIEIAATAMPAGGNPPTAGASYTVTSSAIAIGAIEDSLTVASPTQYPFVKNSGGGNTYWTDLGVVFGIAGVTTTTSTTTLNTGCLGACSNGNNGTKTYFSVSMPRLFIYDWSQNTASPSQVDNVTLKLGKVNIKTSTGTGYILVYMPATPTSPASAGNLWTLVPTTGTTTFPLINGTTNQFIHVNPQAIICASCFYAVGVFVNTNASRSSGVPSGGSGVSFYETGQLGLPQYSHNPPSTTPQQTFYENTAYTPYIFLYVHTTFTVATFTSTTTSTITQGATATSTVTSTLTSTTWDVSITTKATSTDAILLLVVLGPAMIMMVPIAIYTKSAAGAGIGFVAGLMVGTSIAVQSSMVPPVFLAIMIIVGLFVIVGLIRGSGGA